MLNHLPILSILIWLPVVTAMVIMGLNKREQVRTVQAIAIASSLVSMLLCLPLFFQFDIHSTAMQFRETWTWVSAYHIQYDIGVDGISLPLIMLSCFTTLLVVLASIVSIKEKVSQYLASFMLLQGMMVGVFMSIDAMLFYVFWEGLLIPMYICIGVWGGANRSYASIKFFLFTFLGSAVLLVALLYLHLKTGSFSLIDFMDVKLSLNEQIWIFLAFLLAFAVKVPMWPVHTWLPDAHTEAPAGGSVVLAALMLKMGIYGFLRFNLPITPDASSTLSWLMIVLSLIAIVYIGFIAIVQKDMKRLVAYSSIAHMGFATLGCFMIYQIFHVTGNMKDAYISLEGGMVQMLSHAFSSGAMFLGIGVLYDALHTRNIKDYGGVASKMPVFAALYLVFVMSNIGLPGTAGFVGEFMVILSAFRADFWIAFLAAMSLILGAAYSLWMFKRVFYGKITNEKVASLTDIGLTYKIVFILLVGAVFAIGLFPQLFLNVYHTSVEDLLVHSLLSKL